MGELQLDKKSFVKYVPSLSFVDIESRAIKALALVQCTVQRQPHAHTMLNALPPPARFSPSARPTHAAKLVKPTGIRPSSRSHFKRKTAGVFLGFCPTAADGTRQAAFVSVGAMRAATPRAVSCVTGALTKLSVLETTEFIRARYAPSFEATPKQ